jgi:pimeloyl-ACP methyl ester carboxylesterase
VRHRVANLDGPVHYIDFGGSGTPLLMVHGLGGNALNWMAVRPQLAESYHALAIDLAGFGQTPLFGRSATVGAHAELVHGFITRVIGEPAALMGNSMGGHVSMLEAAAHPDSVISLVLVDPAIPGPHVRRPEPRMLGAMAAISVPGLAETLLDRELRSLGPEGLVRRALELVCADPSQLDPDIVNAHMQLTREREHLGPQNMRTFIQATRSIGLRMADPRFWSRVAAVKARTLIIQGSVDRLIPVAAARELHRRRPDWELKVLEGVGHVPMLEAPDLFMDALHGWTANRIPSAAAAS